MIATSQDMVQSQPHSHMEYVNFEPSQHTTINKLEDFHIVTAVIILDYKVLIIFFIFV
jgi:hypothetical protein